MAPKAYPAHCDCNNVEWTVTLDDDKQNHILCHCNTCKRLSGAPYTLNQIVPSSAIKITKGEEGIKKYTYTGASGNPVHCYYCGNCTSHIYHHQTAMGPDTYIARTLMVDGGDQLKPSAEIFGKARLTWLPEVAKTFETVPPS
ncbi:MAG: hypothetical protein M1834_007642 [Cirrosporium novae-zelandiae]|nr:MAG: hypothetical protein M1834_007642 [Cirrosporium novae-zelandiae]